MSVREKDNPQLYDKIQEQNLLRQYDLLSNCIEIGLEKGIEAFDKVPHLMDMFFSFIHENWNVEGVGDQPTGLAAFALWRLNRIHRFVEGNGRTARAACYYLICLHYGALLPGKRIVPERIRENREPYYAALRAADHAWAEGHIDVSAMADYLADLLKGQLSER